MKLSILARMWARRVVGVVVICVLLLAPAAAAARGGPLSFGAPRRIDNAVLPVQAWAPSSVSCPSAQLCVGVGDSGQLQTSVDPAARGLDGRSARVTA